MMKVNPKQLIRSIASSTAIETDEPIQPIEEKPASEVDPYRKLSDAEMNEILWSWNIG